jgi:hypothetical protein
MKTIEVSGIWLRGAGTDHVQVLAEVDGEWRVVIPPERIHADGTIQTISHIVEPDGIAKAPVAQDIK